jgi:hypothetical protein
VVIVDPDVDERPWEMGDAMAFWRRVSPVVDWTSPGIVSRNTRVRPSSCGLRVLERRLRSVSKNLNTDWAVIYQCCGLGVEEG